MSGSYPRSGNPGKSADRHARAGLAGLIIGAIGVVFGDIGTSPLYTLKQAFTPHYGLTPTHIAVLGVLSLVFWSLMLVVTLKYVTIIMRANNEGEGGIMALMALAQRTLPRASRWSYTVGILGVFGASLFFGDGVITPAITVLSALEGIEVVAPQLHTWVVPLAVLILFVLFATQRFGTAKVGRVFGPIMVLWFATLAVIGVLNIQHEPEVLKSLNPMYAVGFFDRHGWGGVFILGAVVLAVTGGEALYADMGHFGATPIRLAWYFFVLPALMLNYLGQGALVLEDPSAIGHPFYIGVPGWGRIPMIVLATAATIIASQSVITGAFSVARQAMQLGYIPRMRIVHTSRETRGQIYVPWINWALMIAVITLVLTFQRSAELAAAYGVSVSGTMLIDTLLLALVARAMWLRWRWLVLPLCALLLIVDLAFLVANGVKFFEGAWFPVVLGISVFTLLRTWRRGRQLLHEGVLKEGMQVDRFLPDLMRAPPTRVPGTAIFLSSDPGIVPPAILHNLQHNKVLHERNVFLTVETLDVPYAPPAERLKIDPLGTDFYRVLVRYGFMETPDVPRALTRSRELAGIDFDPMETTYFASRETVVAGAQRGMAIWREHLFSLMHRSAAPANGFYRIPGRQLIVVGSQVEI